MLTLAIVYDSTDAHHFLCNKYCVIFGGDVHEISHLILTTDMTTEIPRVKKKKKKKNLFRTTQSGSDEAGIQPMAV